MNGNWQMYMFLYCASAETFLTFAQFQYQNFLSTFLTKDLNSKVLHMHISWKWKSPCALDIMIRHSSSLEERWPSSPVIARRMCGFEDGWWGQFMPGMFCHSEGRTEEQVLRHVLEVWSSRHSSLPACSWQSQCVVARILPLNNASRLPTQFHYQNFLST